MCVSGQRVMRLNSTFENTNQKQLSSLVFLTIIGVQILDVVVHVISDMLEPTRVVSNMIILFGFASVYSKQDSPNSTAKISTSIYVILNLIFVIFNGLVNPETDKLRIPLFFFVGITSVCAWLITRTSAHNPNNHE